MKRILFVTSLCLLASFSFAQKKAVKDAKSAMKNNIQEARDLIKPALENPETATDPETWKIAGDIEYKVFDDQRTIESLKDATGKGSDEAAMYTGLYNMYAPYVKADELGQLPDSKGKIKNKVRDDIQKNLRSAHGYYINGGIYYNDKQDFKKAADFFEIYWEMPNLEMFKDSKLPLVNPLDTANTYHVIKYYASISAVQAQDHDRAIRLLNKIIDEGYAPNSAYKESDPYELLAAEYKTKNDSVSFSNVLAKGAQLFPDNVFFTSNLINEYIKGGRIQDALTYLDQAIANDPNNTCDLMTVKASLYAEQKDYTNAEPTYLAALNADENCEKALEGVGVLYVLQAQDLKELAGQTTNRKEQAELDEKTSALYLKALPYLEKYTDLLRTRNADKADIRLALTKLQNVYYNLSLLKIDKSKELEAIDKELGL